MIRLPFRLEARSGTSRARQIGVPLIAVVAGFAAAALLLELSGTSSYLAFDAMYVGSIGTLAGLEATVLRAAPLVLTGLAVSVALRMKLWNIGGEGQLLMGATAATAVGFALPELPGVLLLPAMLVAGCVGGALWAQIAAIPRATIGVNEIIVSLFLNYVALRAVSWLVFGVWKDEGAIGFAYSRPVPEQSRIGLVPGTGFTDAIVLAVLVVVVVGWVFNRTAWGFAVDISGGNERASSYLGMGSRRHVLAVFGVSGAIAGFAGALQLLGPTGRLQPDLASGYGYAGILVAFLAGRSLAAVIGAGFFYAALIQGGFALQSTGVPSALSTVIQALVILFVLIAGALAQFRVRRVGAAGGRTVPASTAPPTEPTAATGAGEAVGPPGRAPSRSLVDPFVPRSAGR